MAPAVKVYDAKMGTRTKLKILKTVKSQLSTNPIRYKKFMDSVFGPWLLIRTQYHDNHLIHYLLQHQVEVEDCNDESPFKFDIGNHSVVFGRREFCLLTGFRFGDCSLNAYSNKESEFRQRLKPGVHGVSGFELNRILENKTDFNNLLDDDAVRLCLVLVLNHVFMGFEMKHVVSKEVMALVDDFEAWDKFPWGQLMWKEFHSRVYNNDGKVRKTHLNKITTASCPKFIPNYTLQGFVFFIKIWLLETFPDSYKWWKKENNVIPRCVAWSDVTPFTKGDYKSLFYVRTKLNTLTPTKAEMNTSWWKTSLQYFHNVSDASTSSGSGSKNKKTLRKRKLLNDDVSSDGDVHNDVGHKAGLSQQSPRRLLKDDGGDDDVDTNASHDMDLHNNVAHKEGLSQPNHLTKLVSHMYHDIQNRLKKVETKLFSQNDGTMEFEHDLQYFTENLGDENEATNKYEELKMYFDKRLSVVEQKLSGKISNSSDLEQTSNSKGQVEQKISGKISNIDEIEQVEHDLDPKKADNLVRKTSNSKVEDVCCVSDINHDVEDDVEDDHYAQKADNQVDMEVDIVSTKISTSSVLEKTSNSKFNNEVEDKVEHDHEAKNADNQLDMDVDKVSTEKSTSSDLEKSSNSKFNNEVEDKVEHDHEPKNADNQLDMDVDKSSNSKIEDEVEHDLDAKNVHNLVHNELEQPNVTGNTFIHEDDIPFSSSPFDFQPDEPNVNNFLPQENRRNSLTTLDSMKNFDSQLDFEFVAADTLCSMGSQSMNEGLVEGKQKETEPMDTEFTVKEANHGQLDTISNNEALHEVVEGKRCVKLSWKLEDPYTILPDSTPPKPKRVSRFPKKLKKVRVPLKTLDGEIIPAWIEDLNRPTSYNKKRVHPHKEVLDFVVDRQGGEQEFYFPWSEGIIVQKNFWQALLGIGKERKGWLSDNHLELWVTFLSHFRYKDSDWAIVGPYFNNKVMSSGEFLRNITCFAEGVTYGLPWTDESVEKVYFPINMNNIHWILAGLDIRSGIVTFYDSLPGYNYETLKWWLNMKGIYARLLPKLLIQTQVLKSKKIDESTYTITFQDANVPRQGDPYGDCGLWVMRNMYRLINNLPLDEVIDPTLFGLAYRERLTEWFWKYKIPVKKSVTEDDDT